MKPGNKMNINYDTLTIEQLEEHVEFVDWSMVPFHLFTEDIKKSFGSISQLQTRLWFDNLLSQMVIKEDQKRFPDRIFFFIGDECPMNLGLKNWSLWCSHDAIWSILEKKFGNNYIDVQTFIKNVVQQYFKNKEVIPVSDGDEQFIKVEQYFKNKGVNPQSDTFGISSYVKEHFDSKEITPNLALSNDNLFVEEHFKNKPSITVNKILNKTEGYIIESHFNKMEITPKPYTILDSYTVKEYFKKKK